MDIQKIRSGYGLRMTANHLERREIKRLLADDSSIIAKEAMFITEFLGADPMGDGVDYEQVAPEDVGALTGAPLISDGDNIYGFMDYQVVSLLEELANGKTVTWTKG